PSSASSPVLASPDMTDVLLLLAEPHLARALAQAIIRVYLPEATAGGKRLSELVSKPPPPPSAASGGGGGGGGGAPGAAGAAAAAAKPPPADAELALHCLYLLALGDLAYCKVPPSDAPPVPVAAAAGRGRGRGRPYVSYRATDVVT